MGSQNGKAENQPYWDPVLASCRRWTLPLSILAILFALGLVLWVTPIAFAADLMGKAVGITDGDTIAVLDGSNKQFNIRLVGIDAPERAQPYSQRSKHHLSELVYGKPVRVEWTTVDRWGRILGKVWVAPTETCPVVRSDCPMTLDVSLAQISGGMAWHFKRYQMEQSLEDRVRYSDEELDARAKRVGLWKDPKPTPPWEFRAKLQQRTAN